MTESEMDHISKRLKTISNDIKRYVEKRVELLLLDVSEHSTRMLAESVQKVTGALFLLGGLIFLLVALARYLGELLGSISLGYVIVAVPVFIIGIFLVNLKPKAMLERIQQQFMKEVMRALAATSAEQSDETRQLKETFSTDGEKEETQTESKSGH